MTRKQNLEPAIQNSKFKIQNFFILPIVACLFASSCSYKDKVYKKSSLAMDTLITITVSSKSEKTADTAIEKAFNEIARLDKLLNFYSQDSEVALINQAAGERPVTVSKDTFEVIARALYAAEKTGGAFDPTIGAVMPLWNFVEKKIPDRKLLKEHLALVGFKNVLLDREKASVFLKRKGMKIDLGGLAKGYAADRAVEVLKENGIKAGIVAVAGDIKAFGLKPDGTKWNVGIKNPRAQKGKDEIFASSRLSDKAISTAGDYERFFLKDGVRYHHILDPQTGSPAGRCRAVSVITKDGVLTDAFDTGIFVLGPGKGMKLLRDLGFDGVITDSKGKVHVTDGLKNAIEFRDR